MKFSLIFLAIVAVLVVSTETKNCQKVAKKAVKAGKTPPTCNGKKFAPVQCGADSCYCAKEKSGKQLYKNFEFPQSEDYDCSKKPSACISERYGILVSGEGVAPECDANGDYKKEVCTMVPSDTNIALNKPAMQVSEGWGGVPSRGVDGNKNAGYGGASCTHTMNTDGAWWAVDLGAGSQVSRVAITNRKDACCVGRLSNFRVGLTDTDPRTSAPTLDSYTPCATVPGAFGAETRSLECSGTGRFLVVQLQGNNYLTLCEVEVFGVQEICE